MTDDQQEARGRHNAVTTPSDRQKSSERVLAGPSVRSLRRNSGALARP